MLLQNRCCLGYKPRVTRKTCWQLHHPGPECPFGLVLTGVINLHWGCTISGAASCGGLKVKCSFIVSFKNPSMQKTMCQVEGFCLSLTFSQTCRSSIWRFDFTEELLKSFVPTPVLWSATAQGDWLSQCEHSHKMGCLKVASAILTEHENLLPVQCLGLS